jgi:hypothetical protein
MVAVEPSFRRKELQEMARHMLKDTAVRANEVRQKLNEIGPWGL